VAEQDQRDRFGRRRRHPEDTRNLVENELIFDDAVVEATFENELHGHAFRESSETALPDDLSPDRDPRQEHPR